MRWTGEAAERLRQIHEYLVERNPNAAADTVLGLYRTAESLDRLAERGFAHRTRTGHAVRIVLYGHYRIVYQVEDDVVVILGIFHGAMDLPRYLP